MGCAQDAVLKFYFWADVLSTQSTRDPEVVNGIRESMVPRVLLEAAGVRSKPPSSGYFEKRQTRYLVYRRVQTCISHPIFTRNSMFNSNR